MKITIYARKFLFGDMVSIKNIEFKINEGRVFMRIDGDHTTEYELPIEELEALLLSIKLIHENSR